MSRRVANLHLLGILSRAFCEDAGIQLEVGKEDRWSFNPKECRIVVSGPALASKGPWYCAGILAHELGHHLLTHYQRFTELEWRQPYRHLLLNAMEDLRVEQWMARRYPGIGHWLRQIREEELRTIKLTNSFFLDFSLGCVFGWKGGEDPDHLSLPSLLDDVLQRTCMARNRYVAAVPTTGFRWAQLSPVLREKYLSRVSKRLRSDEAGPDHDWALESCYWSLVALETAESSILPEALRLAALDIERIAGFIRGNCLESRTERLLETGDLNGVNLLIREALQPGTAGTPADREGQHILAEALFRCFLEGKKRFQSKTDHVEVPGHQPRCSQSYDTIKRVIQPQVAQLAGRIETGLKRRKRHETQVGYRSGNRVNLPRLMAFHADPGLFATIWQRRRVPRRRSAAILLMVDLSGSMGGGKIRAALQGAVLLAETLESLRIPFAVYGFQDRLIPFIGFDESFGPAQRKRLAEMSLEVSGDRPDGNNQYKYNDDGPCLRDAAAHLGRRSEQDRVLIVISDGRPEGRHSSAEDLYDCVSKVQGSGLTLIGVGLGDDTEHVMDFYPHAVANVPTEQLAARIGQIIDEVLTVLE